jgi:hypothetical protein
VLRNDFIYFEFAKTQNLLLSDHKRLIFSLRDPTVAFGGLSEIHQILAHSSSREGAVLAQHFRVCKHSGMFVHLAVTAIRGHTVPETN